MTYTCDQILPMVFVTTIQQLLQFTMNSIIQTHTPLGMITDKDKGAEKRRVRSPVPRHKKVFS